ncbi:MAG: phosphoribosylaminoimidazolesuccinocarboxamide synthase [Promethearchaeota archaeon]
MSSFEELVRANVNNTVEKTQFPLGKRYQGKVRDNYTTEDGRRVIVATDRLSAFDRVITTIPFKGQLLSQLSNHWFEETKAVVPNHVLDVPDPNVTVAVECTPIPVEVVVRAYITGSAWRAYQKGKDISGVVFPPGLAKNQKLDEVVVTPSTKAEHGLHDEAISEGEILKRKLVQKETYELMVGYALKLFEIGTRACAQRGLILVDTKYEFGTTPRGDLVLIDEIHTPDSSRFWIKETYEERFAAGEEPDILDKEFFRSWLMERGFSGDGEIPDVPVDVKVSLARRYKRSFEAITGKEFVPALEGGSVEERIRSNLEAAGLL